MKEQLVALLGEKTGLDPDKASQVVDTVLNFIKENPEKLAEYLGGGDLGEITGRIGKLFGR